MNETQALIKALGNQFSLVNLPYALGTSVRSLTVQVINDWAYYAGRPVVIDLWKI